MIKILLLMACIILLSTCEQPKLVLVKHGESEWKKLNLFEGWGDSPLSEQGLKEAIQGGKLLKERGYRFDVCYTSILKRSIHTAFHLLNELDQLYIPILKGLHLNDRHYGALEGLNKRETEEKYGSDQVNTWKRSYDIPPPALDEEDERNPANQEKYKYNQNNVLPLPLHESLKETNDRVISYFKEVIFPDIKSGKNVLVTAHDDTLRAIIKHLYNISEQEIIDLDIPNAIPLVHEFDYDLKPIKSYYLGNGDTFKNKINSFNFLNSNYTIIIVDKLNKQQEKEVWEIVKKSDKDFIPPLSERKDTVHKFIGHNPEKTEKRVNPEKNGKNQEGPLKFFEEIKKESFLLVLNNGKIEGFFSIIKDYSLEIEQGKIICDYITTIIIDKNCRNRGHTQRMYNFLLNERKEKNIATRTWSTNYAHIHILGNLGFKLVHRDINDRGPNIDSVYYLKKPKKI